MREEIKEIREYIACPQFGDNYYGEWGALRLDQRIKIKQLLDYITNLQQENEKLKDWNKKLIRDDLEYVNKSFEQNNYKSRCDKAIEYIEDNIRGNYFRRYDDEVYKFCDDILNILKGSDENE